MNVTVKDEYIEEQELEIADSLSPKESSQKDAGRSATDTDKTEKLWPKANQYESRVYPRTFQPLETRYRLIKRDPQNTKSLIFDGIEHSTTTLDLSAGGLRFNSRTLLAIGSILELKIKLGEGEKSIECLAKVCRVEEDNTKNAYTIITHYLDISSTERALINKFVESQLKQEQNIEVQQKAI